MHDPQAIADLFDLGTASQLTGPLTGGHHGDTWMLTTDTGRWAVKRSLRPVTEAEVTASARLQGAARAAGVTTPELRRTRDGVVFAATESGTLRVHRWLDLAEPDPTVDATAIGTILGSIHALPQFDGDQDAAELDPWYVEPVGQLRWYGLVADGQAVDAPFARWLGSIVDELVTLDALVVEPAVVRTCHRRLWADNVRSLPDGRLCVIDWDECGPADPSHELAALLFEHAHLDHDRAATMYAAYCAAGGSGRVEQRSDFSMAICQLGHLIEIACRRWLSPAASARDRAVAEERLGHFVTKPLDRNAIDGLLGVTRAAATSTGRWRP